MSEQTAIRYPKRSDYEPNVKAFLPGVAGEELQMRASLLLLRDGAMSTKPLASEYGWAVLDVVERMASQFAFQPMPLDALKSIRQCAVMLVAQASTLDAVLSPQLPLGEADDRG